MFPPAASINFRPAPPKWLNTRDMDDSGHQMLVDESIGNWQCEWHLWSLYLGPSVCLHFTQSRFPWRQINWEFPDIVSVVPGFMRISMHLFLTSAVGCFYLVLFNTFTHNDTPSFARFIEAHWVKTSALVLVGVASMRCQCPLVPEPVWANVRHWGLCDVH